MKSLAYFSGAIAAIVLSASAAWAQEASPNSLLAPVHKIVIQTAATQKTEAEKAAQKQKDVAAAQQLLHVVGAASLISAIPSAERIKQQNKDYAVLVRGDEALKAGDPDSAIAAYLEARQTKTEFLVALVRLADAYTVAGRTQEAIAAYRQLIYPPPGKDWSQANQLSPKKQMTFSLLLLQTGQEAEALAAYRRALKPLNYDSSGIPLAPIPLPDIGPGGLPYSPQLLQAMDDIGIGIDSAGFDGPKLKEAVHLAPDSAVAYFYLGRYLCSCNDSSARGPLERAIQLGDAKTAKAAKDLLPLCH